MATAIRRHNVNFLGGDLNMAAFVAVAELRAQGVDATFLGSYAWRAQEHTRGGGATPVAGLEGCRYDSLALFAVTPVTTFSRLHTLPAFRGEGASELRCFDLAQGYAASAYQGGEAAILAA